MLERFLTGIALGLKQRDYDNRRIEEIVAVLRKKWENHIVFANPLHITNAMFGDGDDALEYPGSTHTIRNDELLPNTDLSFITLLRCRELFEREAAILRWQKYYEDSGLREQFFPPIEADAINERGEYGRTALHVAVDDGDFDAVCRLTDNGANLSIVDNNGHTPLQFAVALGASEEIILYLTDVELAQE